MFFHSNANRTSATTAKTFENLFVVEKFHDPIYKLHSFLMAHDDGNKMRLKEKPHKNPNDLLP